MSASGRFAVTGTDGSSGALFGWFDSASQRKEEAPKGRPSSRNYLALMIEGPSRDGHYVRPADRTGTGQGSISRDGPTIRPDGVVHEWSIRYSTAQAGGGGRIDLAFDGVRSSLNLEPGHRRQGASFDRFGLFNFQSGGQHVLLYLDDLSYTASADAVRRKAGLGR